MSVSQAKLKGNLPAIADYFLEADRDLGDYYVSKDGEPEAAPPRPLGTLAQRLGLTGEITAEQLLRLLDGRHPITGKRLVAYRKDRVAGVDQTASAPKSVSVVWAVGDLEERQAVERAQDVAVTAMTEYMRLHCPLVRDHGEPQLARDVLVVAVDHHTSRQTEQQSARGTAPDAQVHTHAIWLAAERQDGMLCAIYRDGIWKDRVEWEAAYHCALATELARSGFPIRRMTGRGGRYFEIDGIPATLAKRWSGRSTEVTERMEAAATRIREKTGREPTVVELRREVARSRGRKVHGHKTHLRHYWRSIAELEGVTPEGLARLRRGGVVSEAEARAIVTDELLGPDGLTKEHATFSGRDLRIAALRRGAGLLDVAQAEQLVRDLQSCGELRLTGEDRWTTRRMWEQEQRVLAWHKERTGEGNGAPVRASQVRLLRTLVKHARDRAARLSVEQFAVLTQMLGRRTTAVRGWAGTGKGTVVRAAGEVWRSANRRVMTIAVAGKKAVELAADLGEGTTHMTIAQFIHRREHQQLELHDTDVIVLDEASMVSTGQWDALARTMGKTGTLVMLGDDAQLPAIEAGGLWPFLSQGGPELTTVYRTRAGWERDATTHLRQGRSAEAFVTYAAHGRVRLASTRAKSLERAVHDWARDGRTGLLVTDATNAERDWLNREAQRHRLLAGELSSPGVTVERDAGSMTLHAGDRVLFTAAYSLLDGGRVENGTTALVESVDAQRGTVTVQTAGVSRQAIQLWAATAPLDLHYAAHVYKAQGTTVDRAYVLTGGWQMAKESLYVAYTRARDMTRLYLDRETLGRDIDAEAIGEAARRAAASRAKVAASRQPSEAGSTGTGPAGDADGRYARAAARLRRIQRRRKARRERPDGRPLSERYQLRKQRQAALRDGRIERESEGLRRRHENDRPRPTLAAIAAQEGVPDWALEVAQYVTDRSYVAEQAARQPERSVVG